MIPSSIPMVGQGSAAQQHIQIGRLASAIKFAFSFDDADERDHSEDYNIVLGHNIYYN